MTDLLIRLAHEHPELRPAVLPSLRASAADDQFIAGAIRLASKHPEVYAALDPVLGKASPSVMDRAMSIFKRYKEDHPKTQKTPKDFAKDAPKDKSKGEDKPEGKGLSGMSDSDLQAKKKDLYHKIPDWNKVRGTPKEKEYRDMMREMSSITNEQKARVRKQARAILIRVAQLHPRLRADLVPLIRMG